MHRNFLCIDLKSFYASCECVLRGLDPFKTPLVVADGSRGGGSIVLAVTPFLKAKGVPSRCRIFELPEIEDLIMAKPRMRIYTKFSAEIIGIYLDYVSEEDMHIYSVDEVFLDVTEYLNYHKKTDVELAEAIIAKVYQKTGIPSTCGIGPNMLLSKIALDIESKKNKDMIAKWTYDDVPTKLWSITPLSKMWGIGPRMEKRLNRLGIKSIGDIAKYDKTKLKQEFGVMGLELYYHSHGIDQTRIRKGSYKPKNKSIGHGQTLFKDYYGHNIRIIIMEIIDDVTRRMRQGDYHGDTIHLGVTYSKDVGGGFGRQTKLGQPTQDSDTIFKACSMLFDKFYDDSPIRKVRVAVSNLKKKHNYLQLNIFESPEAQIKRDNLANAVDEIKVRYGKNSILRGTSYTKDATALKRNKMIGGHNSD